MGFQPHQPVQSAARVIGLKIFSRIEYRLAHAWWRYEDERARRRNTVSSWHPVPSEKMHEDVSGTIPKDLADCAWRRQAIAITSGNPGRCSVMGFSLWCRTLAD